MQGNSFLHPPAQESTDMAGQGKSTRIARVEDHRLLGQALGSSHRAHRVYRPPLAHQEEMPIRPTPAWAAA